jgi:surfeit locus 1 family protein
MSAIAVAALILLLLLGRWQWDRYQFKRALAAEPVAETTIENYEPLPDGLVLVHGLDPDGGEGWRVFAPVRAGDQVIFIDSDFIPGSTEPSWREIRLPSALRFNTAIRGASIRPGPPVPLAPAPHPLNRVWYDVDLPAMARAAGLTNVANYYIACAYVGADGRAVPNPFAHAPGMDSLPPERHLGYAFTWWGLAIVLVVIYFAYHRSVGRLKFTQPKPRD